MATIPTFPTFAAGEELSAEKLNQLAIAGAFYGSPPRAKISRTAAYTLTPGATSFVLVMDNVDYDTDNMVDLTAQSTRITFATPGRYDVKGMFSFDESGTGTGFIRTASIRKNAVSPAFAAQTFTKPGATTPAPSIVVVGDEYFDAGDYIQLYASWDVSMSLNTRPNLGIYLSARWVGAD